MKKGGVRRVERWAGGVWVKEGSEGKNNSGRRAHQIYKGHTPWIPREDFPLLTAFRACSICNNLPEGENVVRLNA